MPRADISPLADEDVCEIWRYTADTWSEQRAQRYVDDLFDMMEALASEPKRGRRADEISEGLWRQRCGSHVIFYREIESGVLVVRVLHQSMDFALHLANDDT